MRTSVKYLGAHYNSHLSIKFSIDALKAKESFIFSKLYRFLRISDFRVRYNLWQVFIAPLLRMIVSLCGPVGNLRASTNFKIIRLRARTSLKRLCFAPRASLTCVFDAMTNFSDGHLDMLLQRWRWLGEKRTGSTIITDRLGYLHLEYDAEEQDRIKTFHPDIDSILKTVNYYHCNVHTDQILTV